jgi:predicted N-acetyltransferase YhbS
MLAPVPITMRLEPPSDHRVVKSLTREASWGSKGPGCSEHLLVHRLRDADSHVPELDVVAGADDVAVGHIVYTCARVIGEPATWDVLTFVPLSVLPEHQGTGVGGTLMRHPDYYPRFGFVRAADVGIAAPGGATFDGLMALALVDGFRYGVRGEFHIDPVFQLDPADVGRLSQRGGRAPAEQCRTATCSARSRVRVRHAVGDEPRHVPDQVSTAAGSTRRWRRLRR